MARTLFLITLTVAVVIAALLQKANAIKCWQCSSHVPFCDDPFNPNNITAQQRAYAYKECVLTGSQTQPFNQHAVCKKLKQIINDKFVITRSCYWKNADAPIEECLENITPPHIKTEFCQACDEDGCNSAVKYGPIALIIAAPMMIATVLLI